MTEMEEEEEIIFREIDLEMEIIKIEEISEETSIEEETIEEETEEETEGEDKIEITMEIRKETPKRFMSPI